jgi:glycosyltransferase involved in cell wall biosynthesis
VISIIVNCWNGGEHLSEAMESAVAQSYKDWELIFWDNASDPPLREYVEGLGDERIRYFMADRHTPLGEARNLALARAKGDYIAFLDADDFWSVDKLAKQLPLFEQNPEVGLVYSDAHIVHEGVVTKRVFENQAMPEGLVFGQLLGSYFLVMSSVIIRRKALDDLLVWFDPRYEIVEEYDLFLRIAMNWQLAAVPEVLASWRWHDASTTMRKRRLISVEKRLLLKQLKRTYPEFMAEHKAIEDQVRGKILISSALSAYNSGHPGRARRLLLKSRKWTPKGVVAFVATFFPPKQFNAFYRRVKGNPLV